ncbi:hypothetical protein FB451DRAFT_1181562 [Mycena latifolia]|nr:hypothetical protein FB451DRAFT_1181562 [Mycena latifolia]
MDDDSDRDMLDTMIPLPAENIPANWVKIAAIIKMPLPRSGRKSRVKINNDDKGFAPPPSARAFFQCTPAIIKGTPCPMNIILCPHSDVYPIELYDKLGEPVVKIPKESANTLIRTTCTSPMQKTSTSSDGASMTSLKWLRRLNNMSAEGEDRDGVE